MALDFNHVKPGNYKLYINEGFTKHGNIIGETIITVKIGEKVVYSNEYFPNSGENQILAEHFICDIRLKDFELEKLDNNGDDVILILLVELISSMALICCYFEKMHNYY